MTIELARAAPPGADNAKPLIFSLRAPGESEGYGWIDALKGSSYARLKEANEVMRQQCDDFAADIYLPWNARRPPLQKRSSRRNVQLWPPTRGANALLDGVASIYERGVAQRDDVKPPVPGDDDALLAAVEALLDAHSADLASLKQDHEAQAEKRREAGRHLAAELAEAQQQARDAQADVAALRTANDALRARHKLLVREVKKSRSAQAGPPAEDTDEASQEEAPSEPEPPAPPAPEPEDDEEAARASDARRAAFRADIRKALDLNVARTAAAEFERQGLSAPDDDAAIDSEKPDEKWLEDDEDAPIAGLPGVQVLKYERPTIGINFEVREAVWS